MSDLVVSVIRTWVPIGVGVVLSTLAAKGLEVDETTKVNLVAGLTGLVSAVYYLLARLLEKRWAIFGFLLGKRKTPTY